MILYATIVSVVLDEEDVMKQINFDCSDRMCVSDFFPSERRQRSDFIMCLFFSLFLLAPVCCAFRSVPPPLPIVLTAADNGTTVTVSPETPIIIQLADNSGSTGYAWSFFATGGPVVELQGTRSFADSFASSSPPRFGASGATEFTFVTQNTGIALLQFALRRPWETGVAAAQRFGVVIHVVAPSIH
jgi:predicted secreted protein